MKRFIAGVLAGLALAALALCADTRTIEIIVQPRVITENEKVKITRLVLKPGEASPIHTHSLDHIAVILQGSTMEDMGTDGKSKSVDQKTGEVHYVPGSGRTHSFANSGTTPLEIVSIELK